MIHVETMRQYFFVFPNQQMQQQNYSEQNAVKEHGFTGVFPKLQPNLRILVQNKVWLSPRSSLDCHRLRFDCIDLHKAI